MTTIIVNDPDWVKQIAYDAAFTENLKERKLLKELFIEYLCEGYSPLEAYNKAKKIASAFNLK